MSHSTNNFLKVVEQDGATVLEALAAVEADCPEAVAVDYRYTERSLTYSDLARIRRSIAVNLRDDGLPIGARVAVYTTQSFVSVKAMAGIWTAGMVYSPINPAYRTDLLAYQLNDLQAEAIIVDKSLLSELEAVRGQLLAVPRVYLIDGDGSDGSDSTFTTSDYDVLESPVARDPQVEVGFDTPANIIYTSGTTGPAKGVLQSHRWMNQYSWLRRSLHTSEDVVYCDLPMYHVGGAMFNVVAAWWVGATVSLWDKFSTTEFWKRVAHSGATSATLVDVMVPWVSGGEPSPADRNNTLRLVHMQPLPLFHQEFCARFGINIATAGFGQTESGMSLNVVVCESEDWVEGVPTATLETLKEVGVPVLPAAAVTGRGFMGAAAPFVEVEVHNERDEVCAPDEVGELVIRSKAPAILLDEYINKPDASASALRNQWFHSGDAASRGADGYFRFVDRMSGRLRVKGENISSYHVEEMLTKHEQVQVAAVIAVPSVEGEEDDIAAYIQGGDVDVDAIRKYCEETMPKFMRPRYITVIDEIPRTPTNKIEKYKLRAQFEYSVN
ncbi:AMP-binding protein [Brevibacterium jeotgali]|uniref:Crotonobetaine/carnitine-CoA ligase n=1 Tax=Brevibacterium jeotgali TaxID=1262550 RepID=A0A2H1L6V2_9MICO|nr:AMP-binding protein [Brevibacterium jeotgali]TWC02321.1 crotonobetaine/carnitine-CoA ligase [Brevibacterium jeotgali]SMY12627.1 crotonobetaine/carnitine-CoA ligase [Brevibacterium jeotgali]